MRRWRCVIATRAAMSRPRCDRWLVTPRRWSVSSTREHRLRLRQQPQGTGEEGRLREGLRLPRIRSRLHPAALLPGEGAVPVGRTLRRSRRHPSDRRGDSRDVSERSLPRALDPAGGGEGGLPRAACPDLLARATGSAIGSARVFNDLVARGEIKAPIVIGRDHLDAGSVASPYRETEGMRDGSDAIADWPLLNALVNTACGASWVSIHHGGGVGIGNSIHAGMVVVADGLAGGRGAALARADLGPGNGGRAARRRGVRGCDRLRPRDGPQNPDVGGLSARAGRPSAAARLIADHDGRRGDSAARGRCPGDRPSRGRGGRDQGRADRRGRPEREYRRALRRTRGCDARSWRLHDPSRDSSIPTPTSSLPGRARTSSRCASPGSPTWRSPPPAGGFSPACGPFGTPATRRSCSQTRARLDRMLAHGTTTIEAKSGYGLSTEQELRALVCWIELEAEHPIGIVSTFLGAHEFRPNTGTTGRPTSGSSVRR